MSHPLDADALYHCGCGEWHYKHECFAPPCERSKMHARVKEAFEQIDAAVFNGDTFDDADAKAELTSYLRRWVTRLRLKAAINRKS